MDPDVEIAPHMRAFGSLPLPLKVTFTVFPR
jgi:hypothetical protein